jgi:hypothetical protein
MKKIIFAATILFTMYSCKKDSDANTDNSPTTNSPVITSTTVINSMLPNKKIGGYRLDSGIIAKPNSGINQSFNYWNVPAGMPWSESLKTPINLTAYPTATYMTGTNQSFLGQSFAMNQYYKLSNQSWNDLGGYFGAAFNFNYSGYAVNIPQQATKNNPEQILVNFPIKYNDSINQIATSSYTMQISGTVSGFTFNGPLTATTTTTVYSKNIAYGYLKIRSYTDSMPVVVQQYATEAKTNFSSTNILINSLLSSILSQLNLPNNGIVYNTEYRFWAKDKGLVMRREGNGVAFIRTGL